MKEGQKIEILVHNYKTGQDEWLAGEFIKYISATDCDHRIECKTDCGRVYEGNGAAHPDCVRTK